MKDDTRFVLPRYPYDLLDEVRQLADAHEGGVVDLSVGTPCDPPPACVLEAMCKSGTEHSYPSSVGNKAYREAAAEWLYRRLGVALSPEHIGACIGAKEFVATTPQWLRLHDPGKDTILYPALSYPTYAMGALLAGCRAVPVPLDSSFNMELEAIEASDARRALAIWVNTPSNPTGAIADLKSVIEWGRQWGVTVLSDECYVEFTWEGSRQSALQFGSDGVISLHSLSKRSNMAGMRAGFYAGDPDLVSYLSEVRKHAGFMVPGPVQVAATAALLDNEHVDVQRQRYLERLQLCRQLFVDLGMDVVLPAGGFYIWLGVEEAISRWHEFLDKFDWDQPKTSSFAFCYLLASAGGALVSPGEFYGALGEGYVRIAMVQPLERLQVIAERLKSQLI
ncbi:MAG: aminotransferase class I/II-fold pyridoxal phosphate-dependent enzyme [Actinobacteria bacterium]|nr:aminotransferase class I/II-fold pyridoxal phosphate-dependent enzyme [Actinomycetota bacterium]MCL6095257.1 aminotransferase class I/II-fold pyridoxal phosphate-dependent enzyme [Actinomycetota bacterium]